MTAILQPGVTCGFLGAARDAGVLIDGRAYYRAVYEAARQARRYLLIAGWQLDTDVSLLRGADARADQPVQLLAFLSSLCAETPELEVRILAWDTSRLFLLEREPLQTLAFARNGHARIRVVYDDCHPIGGSHHQKLIVVDRAIAFVGGMDVCSSRWDDRGHLADDPRRVARFGARYAPYHDLQAYVTGDAVDALTRWFADRWRCASGETLALPRIRRRAIRIEPTLRVAAPAIGLARTLPRVAGVRAGSIEELRALHVAAIAAARRVIYVENQYVSSDDVRQALLARLRRPATPPLEIVMVLPERTKALKERVSLGARQVEMLRELAAEAARGGHRFGAYHTVAPDGDREVPVYIHAKVLVVDDRFLLVSSANLTNRSMGLDTELGLAWESPRPRRAIRAVRVELLREHTGLPPDGASVLEPAVGLVDRLDHLARSRRGRLRFHPMEEKDTLLAQLVPPTLELDPDGPVLDDALWEATDGGGERGLLERLRNAWQMLRNGLSRTSSSAGEGETGGTSVALAERT